MPSEAQIKAQIAAALAKKKAAAAKTDTKPQTSSSTPTPTPPPSSSTADTPPTSPTKPSIEVTTTSTLDRRPTPPTADSSPHQLTFAGFPIRVAIDKNQVYFALADLFVLAKDHEWPNKFIDFKNNPKTKAQADELIKVVNFTGPDGNDKTEGATAENALAIMRALNFTLPGPLGRWLRETTKNLVSN